MYLSKLSVEQKNAFLDACIYIANADNFVAKEEKVLIDSLCEEMNLPCREVASLDFNVAIDNLANSSNMEQKKQLLFEFVGIVYSDNYIDQKEVELIKIIMSRFEINENDYDRVMKMANDLFLLYKDINKYIKE